MHIDKYGVGWRDEYAARGFWLGIKAALALVAMLVLAALLVGCGTSHEPASPQITDSQYRDIVDGTHGRALEALAARIAALEPPACSHAACHAMGKAPPAPVRFGAMTEGDGR